MTDFRMGSRMCDYCQRNLPSGELCGCDGEKEARFRWMDKLIANGVSADLPSGSSREDRLAAMLSVAIEDHDSSVGCSMREAHWTNQARALLASTPAQPVDETERLDALAAAFVAGATAVHNEWLTNPGEAPRGDPEFGEAASDYARAALSTDKGEASRG